MELIPSVLRIILYSTKAYVNCVTIVEGFQECGARVNDCD
jgi:hypothetical protein